MMHISRAAEMGQNLNLAKDNGLQPRTMMQMLENKVHELLIEKILDRSVELAQDYPVSVCPN